MKTSETSSPCFPSQSSRPSSLNRLNLLVQRRLAEAVRRKEERGERLLAMLEQESRHFMPRVHEYLQYDERNREVKREQLFAEWSEKVFNPIQVRNNITEAGNVETRLWNGPSQ